MPLESGLVHGPGEGNSHWVIHVLHAFSLRYEFNDNLCATFVETLTGNNMNVLGL
jgi:hypothetical protein